MTQIGSKNLLLENEDFLLSTKCQEKLSLLFTRKCISCWSLEKRNPHYSKHSTAEVDIFKQGYLWAAAKRSIIAAGHRSRSKFQTDMQGSTILVQHCLGQSYYYIIIIWKWPQGQLSANADREIS